MGRAAWRYENYSQIMIVYSLKFHTKKHKKLESIVLYKHYNTAHCAAATTEPLVAKYIKITAVMVGHYCVQKCSALTVVICSIQ